MVKVSEKIISKEKIYSLLLDRILFLHYPPGTVLNEKRLMDEFKVNRSPLREVLKRLEWELLITTLPRMGSIVTEINYGQIIQVFQMRFELEDFACRLATKNITSIHLNQIEKISHDVKSLFNLIPPDRRKLIDADMRFREILYNATGNPILSDVSESLYHLTIRFHSLDFKESDWVQASITLYNEINELRQAFIEKDAIKAGRTRKKYLRENLERVKKKF
jgi:DNA-binding GntR family transcriptional regulator